MIPLVGESKYQYKFHYHCNKSASNLALSNFVRTRFLLVDRKPEVVVSRSAEECALRGHVIGTMHAWDDFACAFSCLHTKNCFSFNFKGSFQPCELNHSNKLASPQDIVVDSDAIYYDLVFS